MKILMLSDFHIHDKDDVYRAMRLINEMKKTVIKQLEKNEKIIILICGDLVNYDTVDFSNSVTVLNLIKNTFAQYTVDMLFVPGNHDIRGGAFVEFDEVASNFSENHTPFSEYTIASKQYKHVNFILANSVFEGKYNNPMIDYDKIPISYSLDSLNILVCHHSPIPEVEGDVYLNQSHLLNKIEGIPYLLHGHTHGCKTEQFGNMLKIGVGSAFKPEENINTQFNLLSVGPSSFLGGINFRYFQDRTQYYPDRIQELNFMSNYDFSERPVFNQPIGYQERLLKYTVAKDENKTTNASLYDYVITDRLVVLLGDAGSGKSYELRNLAYIASCRKDGYYPIFFDLKFYTGEKIEQIVSSSKISGIEVPMILFDGYDEIHSSMVNKFIQEITSYSSVNKKVIIIVSSRKNFYVNSFQENDHGTLPGFREVEMMELTESQVGKITGHDIDQIKSKIGNNIVDLLSMAPFFSDIISELNLDDIKEWNTAKVMKMFILKKVDKVKLAQITRERDSKVAERVYKILMKLAFVMQCLQSISLSNDEYNRFLESEERLLINYCTIFNSDDKKIWTFSHNNLREYLVADFLCNLDFENLKILLTYKENPRKFNKFWSNVLTYYINLTDDTHFIEWICNLEPLILLSLETEKIDLDRRTDMLLQILKDAKCKNVWLDINYNDIAKYTVYCQSPKLIDYLLTDIRNGHFRAKHNALNILREITETFEKENQIKEVLKWACTSDEVRRYEKRYAILALTNSKICDVEITIFLMSHFGESDIPEIRSAIYSHLLAVDKCDQYIDFIVDGIRRNAQKRSDLDIGEMIKLDECLKQVKSDESTYTILNLFNDDKFSYRYNRADELIELMINNAIKFYLHGNIIFYDLIWTIYVDSSLGFYMRHNVQLFKFLDETNTRFTFYNDIITKYNEFDKIVILESVMNEECIDDFIKRFIYDLLDEPTIFTDYAQRLWMGDYRYSEILSLANKNADYSIPVRVRRDNNERLSHIQNVFDLLFYKDKYYEAIEGLINWACNNEVTVEELINLEFEDERNVYTDILVWQVYHSELKEHKLNEFYTIVNWYEYAIRNIYEMVIEYGSDININEYQASFIVDYCHKTAKEVNVTEEVKYLDKQVRFSRRVQRIAYFSKHFDINYSKDIYKKFLYIPEYFFEKDSRYETRFPDYILKKLPERDVLDQVQYNLLNLELIGSIADVHISYCMEKNKDWAKDLAIRRCLEADSDSLVMRKNLEYIAEIISEQFIYDKLLIKNPAILESVMSIYKSNRSKSLIEFIRKSYLDEPSERKLIFMIELNSIDGLKEFIRIAKSNNATPNLSKEKDHINYLAESIGMIDDIRLLNQLKELIKIRFGKNFEDGEHYNLYNSLSKAIRNIANTDHVVVINLLRKLITEDEENDDLKSFVFSHINSIETEYYQGLNNNWTYNDIEKYIENFMES